MPLNTKTFTQMVSDQVAAIQSRTTQLINFTIGSVLRALVEANSSVGLWMQGMIVQLLATTRAATSTGSDVDTWMADFGITRLPAVPASGMVTFSRFTPTVQAIIPFGAIVQTADGTQKYAVTVDTTNSAYTPAGYVIAAGTSSVTVPALALSAAAAGNVAPNMITTLSQAITYVDTVNNANAFANGANAETDAALRTRFIAYLASLSRATKAAVAYAISTVQTTATYTLLENQQYNGATDNGYFTVVVDDGSGAPPNSFINACANAIDAIRPITTRFGIFPPVVINASVTISITIATGYDLVATRAAVQAAITSYIGGLVLGQSLAFTRLTQIAYDASPGVSNITSVTLNGGTADLSVTNKQAIVPSTVTVS